MATSFGVVYVPVFGSLYFASKSIGAFKLDDALNNEVILRKKQLVYHINHGIKGI